MKSVHFIIEELVPPAVFNVLGDTAWDLFDEKAIITLDQLRDYFGPIVVNNWHSGGQYKESGYREATSTTGAQKSRHKAGMAFDCKPVRCTPQSMHAEILNNSKKFPYLTTLEAIESTPTWVHFDTRDNGIPGIRIVKP